MGDSKAPGRSLSESTGLRPHAASVKIDRPIFALASGLKQLAKASCGSPGCLTRWWKKKRRFGRPRLAVRHTAQSRSKYVLYDECSTGGAFDPPTQSTINICMYMYMVHIVPYVVEATIRSIHSAYCAIHCRAYRIVPCIQYVVYSTV